MKIYSLGYQNLSVELYVQNLVNAGVGIILDVREHAWSQRPAFVKSNLQKALSDAGMDYCHIKQAGNPSQNRKTARNARECLARYREHLRSNRGCLDALLLMIRQAEEKGRPACLTCYERKPKECHRSILVDELVKLDPTIITIHLEPTLPTLSSKKLKARPQSLAANAFLSPALLPFT